MLYSRIVQTSGHNLHEIIPWIATSIKKNRLEHVGAHIKEICFTKHYMYVIYIYICISHICVYIYISTLVMQMSFLVWIIVQVLKILIHSIKRESNVLVRALIPGSRFQGLILLHSHFVTLDELLNFSEPQFLFL